MKSFLEITITANEREQELLIPTMTELGCQGFQQTDHALLCYLEKPQWNDAKFESLKKDLRALLNVISVNNAVRFQEIEETNWNEEWERSIKPIAVGKRILVRPSWSASTGDDGRIVLIIDPKMSFGTGYHETTRLTLLLLEKYLTPGASLLDVGTGTGILAIAAIKLGARFAEGIDNDDWCIENASENVTANQCAGRIQISKRSPPDFQTRTFQFITSNITLTTNIEFLGEYRRLLRTDGMLLLSGLLNTDEPAMSRELLSHGFDIKEVCRENEWLAIAVTLSA